MVSFPSLDKLAGNHFAVYEAYFYQADTNKSGNIGSLDAANFLKKSGLSEKVLGQIWELADPSGKGYLDKTGFFVAMKLIAVAQSGLEVSAGDVNKDALLPNLGPLPPGVDQEWDVPPTEKIKYDQIFDDLHPLNGLLTGDKVKPVLINSKLPKEVLGRVWELSDCDRDGMLDREEFAVAMHLVYRALQKEPVPLSLPVSLVPPSKRRKDVMLAGAVPLPGLVGDSGLGPGSPVPWVVSPAEKLKFDEMFKVADTDKDGFVNGVEIKTTFLQSGLQQNVLAHIWNLCDTKLLGKLNSDQFALAMYLIQHKLKGTDPPEKLTTEMIPPSMRAPALDMASGPVSDMSTAGMQELDMIQKEIDDIKREKMQLEQQKVQFDAEVKLRGAEVQNLQKELDVINGTVTKLENQKGEAQKRLDELDDRKTKVNTDIQDYKDKCEEEQTQIRKMKDLINNAESTVKSQESELRRMRDELNVLRREESELEQKVEAGRTQLEQFNKNLASTASKMGQTSVQVEELSAVQPVITDYTRQYQALIDSGDKTDGGPDLETLSAMQAKASATPVQNGVSPTPVMSKPGFASLNGTATTNPDPFTEDPFKSEDDPFKGKAAPPRPPSLIKGHRRGDPFKADPFGGSDPFGDGGAKTGSTEKNGAFGGGFNSLDTLGGGGGGSGAKKAGKDPFGGDPFGGAFGSITTSGGSDPFAPFGGANQLVSPVNPSDPFGTDPFLPDGRGKAPPPRPSKSPIPPSGRRSKSPAPPVPSLPPKQKKAPPPPRPPAPRPGSTKPGAENVTPSTSPMPPDDPFGGFDPFASTGSAGNQGGSLSVGGGGGGGAGFADFSPSKFGSATEADQLAWATRTSQDEFKRQKQLQEQEQRDLELAIKLSQQDNS